MSKRQGQKATGDRARPGAPAASTAASRSKKAEEAYLARFRRPGNRSQGPSSRSGRSRSQARPTVAAESSLEDGPVVASLTPVRRSPQRSVSSPAPLFSLGSLLADAEDVAAAEEPMPAPQSSWLSELCEEHLAMSPAAPISASARQAEEETTTIFAPPSTGSDAKMKGLDTMLRAALGQVRREANACFEEAPLGYAKDEFPTGFLEEVLRRGTDHMLESPSSEEPLMLCKGLAGDKGFSSLTAGEVAGLRDEGRRNEDAETSSPELEALKRAPQGKAVSASRVALLDFASPLRQRNKLASGANQVATEALEELHQQMEADEATEKARKVKIAQRRDDLQVEPGDFVDPKKSTWKEGEEAEEDSATPHENSQTETSSRLHADALLKSPDLCCAKKAGSHLGEVNQEKLAETLVYEEEEHTSEVAAREEEEEWAWKEAELKRAKEECLAQEAVATKAEEYASDAAVKEDEVWKAQLNKAEEERMAHEAAESRGEEDCAREAAAREDQAWKAELKRVDDELLAQEEVEGEKEEVAAAKEEEENEDACKAAELKRAEDELLAQEEAERKAEKERARKAAAEEEEAWKAAELKRRKEKLFVQEAAARTEQDCARQAGAMKRAEEECLVSEAAEGKGEEEEAQEAAELQRAKEKQLGQEAAKRKAQEERAREAAAKEQEEEVWKAAELQRGIEKRLGQAAAARKAQEERAREAAAKEEEEARKAAELQRGIEKRLGQEAAARKAQEERAREAAAKEEEEEEEEEARKAAELQRAIAKRLGQEAAARKGREERARLAKEAAERKAEEHLLNGGFPHQAEKPSSALEASEGSTLEHDEAALRGRTPVPPSRAESARGSLNETLHGLGRRLEKGVVAVRDLRACRAALHVESLMGRISKQLSAVDKAQGRPVQSERSAVASPRLHPGSDSTKAGKRAQESDQSCSMTDDVVVPVDVSGLQEAEEVGKIQLTDSMKEDQEDSIDEVSEMADQQSDAPEQVMPESQEPTPNISRPQKEDGQTRSWLPYVTAMASLAFGYAG